LGEEIAETKATTPNTVLDLSPGEDDFIFWKPSKTEE
jgi:hypothetical protein